MKKYRWQLLILFLTGLVVGVLLLLERRGGLGEIVNVVCCGPGSGAPVVAHPSPAAPINTPHGLFAGSAGESGRR